MFLYSFKYICLYSCGNYHLFFLSMFKHGKHYKTIVFKKQITQIAKLTDIDNPHSNTYILYRFKSSIYHLSVEHQFFIVPFYACVSVTFFVISLFNTTLVFSCTYIF